MSFHFLLHLHIIAFENKLKVRLIIQLVSLYDFLNQKSPYLPTLTLSEKSSFLSKSPNFLSAIAVIPLTVNKIASSGVFGPQNRSFPLYRSPLNTSFTVLRLRTTSKMANSVSPNQGSF